MGAILHPATQLLPSFVLIVISQAGNAVLNADQFYWSVYTVHEQSLSVATSLCNKMEFSVDAN